MSSLWSSLLNLVFPPANRCPFCDAQSPGGAVCGRCLALMESYRRMPRCERCGRLPGKGSIFVDHGGAKLCRECGKQDWPFVLVRAAGPYEGVLKEAIHRFKYAGKRSLAGSLAGLMAEAARAEPVFETIDLAVPVPLAGEKLRLRGFNQAALLAGEVGLRLGLPVDTRSLVKEIETPSQAGLSRPARKSNLENAFRVAGGADFRGKIILVVDDVFTTGSTMSAASSVILRAGACRVFGLTAATGRFM